MKHYLISTSKKPQEVDAPTLEQLSTLLHIDPLCVYFLAIPHTRRGVYDVTLIQGNKLIFSHNKVTLFDATVHLQKQTGINLTHAEKLLKADCESLIITLPA